MTYLRAWLGTLLAFLVIDLAWIVLVVRDLYATQLGPLMRASPGIAASAAFYLFYTAGIVYLAVQPALQAAAILPALLRGAMLGALAYGTYTVTNYAIFESWTMTLLVSDILWGSFLTAACAGFGYLASRGSA
ncbi:MAG: DUF2177 family protein [Woeseia sp.]